MRDGGTRADRSVLEGDHKALSGLSKGIQGRFILSLNDRLEVRRIFADFDIEMVGYAGLIEA